MEESKRDVIKSLKDLAESEFALFSGTGSLSEVELKEKIFQTALAQQRVKG